MAPAIRPTPGSLADAVPDLNWSSAFQDSISPYAMSIFSAEAAIVRLKEFIMQLGDIGLDGLNYQFRSICSDRLRRAVIPRMAAAFADLDADHRANIGVLLSDVDALPDTTIEDLLLSDLVDVYEGLRRVCEMLETECARPLQAPASSQSNGWIKFKLLLATSIVLALVQILEFKLPKRYLPTT